MDLLDVGAKVARIGCVGGLMLLALAVNGQSQALQPVIAQPVAPPAIPREEEQYQIAIDVNLVVLHAVVSDRRGKLVSDLPAQSFEVYEDGVRQTIRLFQREDVPVTVGLVVDHSGSMRRKLTDVIAASRTFARLSNPEDEMFVVNFNEHVTLGLPTAIPFTNRAEELEAALLKSPATGLTALYDAIVEGLNRLQAGRHEKKVLIVISDGGDNASRQRLAGVLKMAEQSSVMIYTIGTFDEQDPDRNPGVLRRLARTTGGEAFFPKELGDVVAISEGIARDIRNQYTIGFASSGGARPGVYRSLRVAAQAEGRGKLSVRSRAGYMAGSEPPHNRQIQ